METYSNKYNADGSVTYWSVYKQQWKIAYEESEITDSDYASMSTEERYDTLKYFQRP